MSCEHEHHDHDHHDHGHGDTDIHRHPPHEPELATSPAQSLLPYVDLPRVSAQNAAEPSNSPAAAAAAAALLREHAHRDATVPQLVPQRGHVTPSDLLLAVPLTGPCRVFSLLLRLVHVTAPESDMNIDDMHVDMNNDMHVPVHLYRNPRDSSIDTIAALSAGSPPKGTSGASLLHPAFTDSHCEHHLPRRHFANTTELVIYFPSFPPDLALVCVELRGEPLHRPPNRGLPTSLQVETAPRLEDHPRVGSLDPFKQHIT